MRVKPGTSLQEAFAALSARQQARVAAIETAREKEDEAIRAVLNRSREGVRKALDAGVPARIIAERIGVSSARVYQMRDEALAYAAERKAAQAQAPEVVAAGQ